MECHICLTITVVITLMVNKGNNHPYFFQGKLYATCPEVFSMTSWRSLYWIRSPYHRNDAWSNTYSPLLSLLHSLLEGVVNHKELLWITYKWMLSLQLEMDNMSWRHLIWVVMWLLCYYQVSFIRLWTISMIPKAIVFMQSLNEGLDEPCGLFRGSSRGLMNSPLNDA